MIPKFRAYVIKLNKIFPVNDLTLNGVDPEPVGVNNCGVPECTCCLDWYQFKDVELMQSTGLKDKNGVDIFEGDIVRITSFPGDWYSTIGHVVWGLDEPMSGAYPAFFIPEFESEMNSFSQIFESGEYEIEVIGNRFENPELLEAK